MELDELRWKLDRVDAEILKLLERRMELALRTRRFKTEVEDPARQATVIGSVKRQSRGLLRTDFTERVFTEIIEESRRQQEGNPVLAGFQGEHGAYSEIAVRTFNAASVPIPNREFADVFDCVELGYLDIGVVPVENSLEGAVTAVNDLLVERDLSVIGEVRVPVHHCLLTLHETDYRDIRVVYSHPQALAQCRGFIGRHRFESRPHYDTAGSAMMLARERPEATAVIANKLCSEIYDLEIVKENIEDHESNSTRFLVISRTPAAEGGDKCSVVFSTPHRSGSLYTVLKLFSEAGINLTRIESRPVRTDPGTYAFLMDFLGSAADPAVQSLLEQLRRHVVSFKLLGCYRETGG